MAQTSGFYAWARVAEELARLGELSQAELSWQAERGFRWAMQLAENAKNRSLDPRLEALKPADIAEQEALSTTTVRRSIVLARRELFGELSESGIYDRRRRAVRRSRRPGRPCEEPGCERWIDRRAHGRRRYCVEHSTPAAAVARHRRASP